MTLAALLGTVLLAAVASDPMDNSTGASHLSAQEKVEATQPLVRSATDCIVRAVAADPRFASASDTQLGDLVVDSMSACLNPVRAMISAYDRYYGDGSGEAFFMGPYLDVLPRAVTDAAPREPE
jgi:hypothetical protein